jgi:Flp pilus assembly protein TadB
MFVVIGLAGILVGLCWYVGYRNRRQFTLQEEEQRPRIIPQVVRRLNSASHSLSFSAGRAASSLAR